MNLYFSGLIKNLQSIGNGFDLMFYFGHFTCLYTVGTNF